MTSTYPGFDYEASQISKFMPSTRFFTIMLKTGEIVHYTPDDIKAFRQWLYAHNIENIKFEKK
jgi:hypothetical protein